MAKARATAAFRRMDRYSLCGVLMSLTVAGCASISEQTAATAFVAPGRYNIYTCQEIDSQIRSAQNRALELEHLMARSAQGAGGWRTVHQRHRVSERVFADPWSDQGDDGSRRRQELRQPRPVVEPTLGILTSRNFLALESTRKRALS
jgi:hypothetical protein